RGEGVDRQPRGVRAPLAAGARGPPPRAADGRRPSGRPALRDPAREQEPHRRCPRRARQALPARADARDRARAGERQDTRRAAAYQSPAGDALRDPRRYLRRRAGGPHASHRAGRRRLRGLAALEPEGRAGAHGAARGTLHEPGGSGEGVRDAAALVRPHAEDRRGARGFAAMSTAAEFSPSSSLDALLLRATRITPEQLEAAHAREEETGRPLLDVLVEQKVIPEEELLRALGAALDLPVRTTIDASRVDPDLVDRVPIAFAKAQGVLPLPRAA